MFPEKERDEPLVMTDKREHREALFQARYQIQQTLTPEQREKLTQWQDQQAQKRDKKMFAE